ncbi:MAG: orotate phosphoribosyltransferase [Clostridia bacterium]|nr:orotate phosphoribosyltransferase [Clostridia bacterium]
MVKEKIASALLEIQAVFLRPEQPFTWASGIRSPIYCDNRLVLSDPGARTLVAEGIAGTIREHYARCEAVVGTATAGIAHAALAANLLGLPMAYVRSSVKEHGRNNRIEGKVLPGQQAVVVEDTISTGGSVIEAVQALQEAGVRVLGIASIFTYGMAKCVRRFAEADIKNVSLTDFDTLVQVAAREGIVSSQDVFKLMAFRDDPSNESWMTRR